MTGRFTGTPPNLSSKFLQLLLLYYTTFTWGPLSGAQRPAAASGKKKRRRSDDHAPAGLSLQPWSDRSCVALMASRGTPKGNDQATRNCSYMWIGWRRSTSSMRPWQAQRIWESWRTPVVITQDRLSLMDGTFGEHTRW